MTMELSQNLNSRTIGGRSNDVTMCNGKAIVAQNNQVSIHCNIRKSIVGNIDFKTRVNYVAINETTVYANTADGAVRKFDLNDPSNVEVVFTSGIFHMEKCENVILCISGYKVFAIVHINDEFTIKATEIPTYVSKTQVLLDEIFFYFIDGFIGVMNVCNSYDKMWKPKVIGIVEFNGNDTLCVAGNRVVQQPNSAHEIVVSNINGLEKENEMRNSPRYRFESAVCGAIAKDEHTIVLYHANGTVTIFDLMSFKELETISVEFDFINDVKIFDGGEKLVILCEKNTQILNIRRY